MFDAHEPVRTALKAQRRTEDAVHSQYNVADMSPKHMQEMATRTGIPVQKFIDMGNGHHDPTLQAALAFHGTVDDSQKLSRKQRRTNSMKEIEMEVASQGSNSRPVSHGGGGSRGLVSPARTPGAGRSTSPPDRMPAHEDRSVQRPDRMPAHVVSAGEFSRPVSPLPGMTTASSSHRTFNKAREDGIGQIGQARSPPSSPMSRKNAGSRPSSQDRQRSRNSSEDVVAYTQSGQAVVVGGGQTGAADNMASARSLMAAGVGGQAAGRGRHEAAAARATGGPAGGAEGYLTGLATTHPSAPRQILRSGTCGLVGVGVDELRRVAETEPLHTGGMLGQLEAIASSGRPRVLQDGLAQTTELMATGQSFHKRGTQSRSPPPQSQVNTTDVLSPAPSPQAARVRTGGLRKMETPTEWSVDSRYTSPAPAQLADDDVQDRDRSDSPVRASVAPQRQRPSSRQSSQDKPSPFFPNSSQDSSGRVARNLPTDALKNDIPKQLVPKDPNEALMERFASTDIDVLSPKELTGPSLGDLLAYPQGDHESAPSRPAKKRYLPTGQAGKRNMFNDPFDQPQLSTSSAGDDLLPAQDSITSTVGSVTSQSRVPALPSGKQGSLAHALRMPARTLNGPGAAGSPDRPMRSTTGSAGFFIAGAGNKIGSVATSSSDGFKPTLGSGDPMRRTLPGGADVQWGARSRSTGSLPLTGMGRNAASASPGKPARPTTQQAKAELATANSEGHLPQLLAAMKPGRIQKGPKTPTWLVPI